MCKVALQTFEKGSDEQIIVTMQLLAQNYPKSIYGMGSFEFGPNLRKQDFNRGLIAKLAKLHLTEGPIAKMNVTTRISSSNYPKIIYGVPLFENLVKIRFDFEFKFKFEIKPKRKKKKKKKNRGTRPHGPVSGARAQLILHGPANRAHLTARGKQKKKEKGCGLADQAHATSPLHGPALRPVSLFSESTALARH